MNKKNLEVRRRVISQFFDVFFRVPNLWVKELIEDYKRNAVFPQLPTMIADYYFDKLDMEIALFSTLCMKWSYGNIYDQVQAMRKIMGSHPYAWFRDREFVLLSTGSEMEKNAAVGICQNWKIARLMLRLYEEVFREDGSFRSFESIFPAGSVKMERFAEKVGKECGFSDWKYIIRVIELVLRTSDGIGRGVWNTYPQRVKCPTSVEMRKFLKLWMPDYQNASWDFDDTVKWFGFDFDYDLFYFWLAWEDLRKRNPKECSRFASFYYTKYDRRLLIRPCLWRDAFPNKVYE